MSVLKAALALAACSFTWRIKEPLRLSQMPRYLTCIDVRQECSSSLSPGILRLSTNIMASVLVASIMRPLARTQCAIRPLQLNDEGSPPLSP